MPSARPRPQVIRLTDAAAERIKYVMANAAQPVIGVRVGVKNGGCAGMTYTMEYAERVEGAGVDRSQGRAVPARHRDGLQGRQALRPIRVQQSQPNLRLRLRRIGQPQ